MRPLTAVEQQWLFTKAQLDTTPSREAGITLADELNRRKEVIDYIESLALRAGLQVDSPYVQDEELMAGAKKTRRIVEQGA